MDENRLVSLARVLPGARPFKNNNVSDTYRGQILTASNEIRGAILKDIPTKELANEVLAAVLGTLAGLPIPRAHIALAIPSVLLASKGPEVGNIGRLVFASEDVHTPPLAQIYRAASQEAANKITERLASWPGLGSLYAFDTWVANLDRHMNNLLFSGDRQIWLIDHGRCFTGHDWQRPNLKPESEYRDKLSEWLTPKLAAAKKEQLANEASTFSYKNKDIDVHAVASANRLLDFLDNSDFEAVVRFLSERRNYIPKLASKALGSSRLL